MKKWKILAVLLFAGLLAGCAFKIAETPFEAKDLSGKGYIQKVDNFVVMLDASSSMFDTYQPMYDGHANKQKCDRAKDVVLHMNDTLPALNLQSGLQVFGPVLGKNFDTSNLTYGMTAYNSADFAAAVKNVKVSGNTPLAAPLDDAAAELKNTSGKIAAILVSDGMNTKSSSPVVAAENLKKAYGDKICIYTILIGDDPAGKQTLADIAAAGQCGFATDEETLSTSEGMANFVEQVFLTKAPAPKPAPVVPKPEPVLYETVTMNLLVEFDFDKATIRPREEDRLDEFAKFMSVYKSTNAVLEGHTDNIGTEKYNMKLSLKRAESVKKHLIAKYNIDPARLSTKGYGFSRPISSNKTDKGRQENRRVVAVISASVEKK